MFISKLHTTQFKFSGKEGGSRIEAPKVSSESREIDSQKTSKKLQGLRKAAIVGIAALGLGTGNEVYKNNEHNNLVSAGSKVEYLLNQNYDAKTDLSGQKNVINKINVRFEVDSQGNESMNGFAPVTVFDKTPDSEIAEVIGPDLNFFTATSGRGYKGVKIFPKSPIDKVIDIPNGVVRSFQSKKRSGGSR